MLQFFLGLKIDYAFNTSLNGWKKEGYEIVGSQDEIKRDINVELLSVKFSKVGQKTFDNYPNFFLSK